jgi:hypothetical protein
MGFKKKCLPTPPPHTFFSGIALSNTVNVKEI